MSFGRLPSRVWVACLVISTAGFSLAVHGSGAARPEIPRTWDPVALADLELPLAGLGVHPVLVSPEYYYAIPERPIHRSYPVYVPGREPARYLEQLLGAEPEIVWHGGDHHPPLETEADWIRAGEQVFDAPISYTPVTPKLREMMVQTFAAGSAGITRDGEIPYYRYVIRKRGTLEMGRRSCAECHTRVMPDGQVVKGAQGNGPFDEFFALAREAPSLERTRDIERELFAAPWARQPAMDQLDAMSAEEIAAQHAVIPAGVLARRGTATYSPVQIPDLIGVHDRRYLDHTGLQRNRGPGDLMRYAALNQGIDALTHYGDFLPGGTANFSGLPDPGLRTRYSDEQLHALSTYIAALQPPPNPNLPKTREEEARVEHGAALFREEGCVRCHDPEQGYTNNKLIAAPGFEVPADHPAREDIMRTAAGSPRRVGTDPTLTLTTRRGTGFYKVPSLLGVWYRGPFEHNGSCLTLEDWFDPARLEDDYVPTGWKGPAGTKTRAVQGHEFGLDLTDDERKSLIAFLRTL